MLFSVLGEGLLFRFIPILVEAAFHFITEMFRPNSGQRPKTTGCFDISDETNDNHLPSWSKKLQQREARKAYRRGFNDRDRFHDLLLVHLGTWPIKIADDGRHAHLVPHGCREMHRLLGVVFGERLDFAAVTACPLSGQKCQ